MSKYLVNDLNGEYKSEAAFTKSTGTLRADSIRANLKLPLWNSNHVLVMGTKLRGDLANLIVGQSVYVSIFEIQCAPRTKPPLWRLQSVYSILLIHLAAIVELWRCALPSQCPC